MLALWFPRFLPPTRRWRHRGALLAKPALGSLCGWRWSRAPRWNCLPALPIFGSAHRPGEVAAFLLPVGWWPQV